MSHSPMVSVVLSVKDGARYLTETIESILNQTYTDFEFIIINDGSSDQTLEIIESFTDERITVLSHQVAKGISTAVNAGLNIAQGKYIARMDGDDLALPERLAKQVAHMEANPRCVALGCSYHLMDEHSHIYRKAYSNFTDDECRFMLMFNYPFCNPSLMMRRDVLEAHKIRYNPEMIVAEDHDLLIRLAEFGTIECLKDYVFVYRTHEGGVSKQKKELMLEKTKSICLPYIQQRTGLTDAQYTEALSAFIDVVCTRKPLTTKEEIKTFSHTYREIVDGYIHCNKGQISPCKVKLGATEFLFKKLLFKDKNIKKPGNLFCIILSNKKLFLYFTAFVLPRMVLKMLK